jgi:hypothetical protein
VFEPAVDERAIRAPLVVVDLESGDQRSSGGDERMPIYERPDFWVAVFTFFLVGSTVLLWKATEKSIEHARKSREHQIRAYVFVNLTELERKKVSKHNISAVGGFSITREPTGRITYGYRNTGKTPAKNVRVAARAIIIRRGNTLNLADAGDPRLVGPLGPKDILTDDIEGEGLTSGALVKPFMKGGEFEIHLHGRIDYDDEFADGRWTTFHTYIGGDVGYDKTMHTHKDGNDFG